MYYAIAWIVATLSLTGEPYVEALYSAVSVFDPFPCDPPQQFVPLFSLIESITRLVYFVAVAAAVLSLTYAGLIYVIGNEDQIRRAKQRVRSVLIGIVLVLMANSIVIFLAVNLGGVCNGGV